MDPDFIHAYMILALDYTLLGRYDEAITHADKAIEMGLTTDAPIMLTYLTWVHAKTGVEDKARKVLEHFIQISNDQFVDPMFLAMIHAGLGENEEALSWLVKGFELHSGQMIYLRAYSDIFFKDLSSDPRYIELLRKIGFKEE